MKGKIDISKWQKYVKLEIRENLGNYADFFVSYSHIVHKLLYLIEKKICTFHIIILLLGKKKEIKYSGQQ